jgi:hypothetical protein
MYEEWISSGNMTYTAGGNLKPPSRLLVCEWVMKAWDSISREYIEKSFKTCAISNATDGSEDDEILCLRPNEPCYCVREDINSLTAEKI